MTAVLILHAYSAENAGDGLLVDHAVAIVREAVGVDAAITVVAGYPESFSYLDVERVVSSKPTRRGYCAEYLSILRAIDSFDLVVGVGGGYLRAGHTLEAVKMLLSHGPQLWRAAGTSAFTVYLPQSVGPLRFGTRRLIERLMSRLDLVMYRDDTSMRELPAAGAVRRADLAAVGIGHARGRELDPADLVPVLSFRSVRGVVPTGIADVADALGTFDGYTQSTVSGNDDTAAMETVGYR
ncbi:MAG: polysaccharide pyruvyl transferase family protein, partial [Nakamurella sp.]